MALAYQSKQDNGATSGTNLPITKPASVTSGDLLVAVLSCTDNTASWTGLDGFTAVLTTSDGSVGVCTVAAKIATGSEGDPFSFDTNANGSGDAKLGVVMRFTGNRNLSVAAAIPSSAGQANSASTTITTPSVTPVYPDNILIFVGTDQGGGNDTSGYAIATDNPSWTEINDITQSTLHLVTAYSSLRTQTNRYWRRNSNNDR